MEGTVRKWGNSLAIRIPNSVAKELELRPGTIVEVTASKGAMTVKPKAKRRYSLAQLLKRITPENLHAEVDFGPPVGKELL